SEFATYNGISPLRPVTAASAAFPCGASILFLDPLEVATMCGIVGYVGTRPAEPILLDGLRRLEYRGYDSAGVATLSGGALHIRKKAGRIADLAKHLRLAHAPGPVGIGHTRWATHGGPSDRNAHPHVAGQGRRAVAVVHNGVIENFAVLKR